MAFITSGSIVISFAEYEDVQAIDQRLFEANEGLTDVIVEDALIKSTTRILNKIRASDWWKNYYIMRTQDLTSISARTGYSLPQPEGAKIKMRRDEFTDMCVYHALSEYLYPRVADFGNTDSAERQKIGFYDEKFREMFRALLDAGDWYDFSGDNTVDISEKQPTHQNLVRIR